MLHSHYFTAIFILAAACRARPRLSVVTSSGLQAQNRMRDRIENVLVLYLLRACSLALLFYCEVLRNCRDFCPREAFYSMKWPIPFVPDTVSYSIMSALAANLLAFCSRLRHFNQPEAFALSSPRPSCFSLLASCPSTRKGSSALSLSFSVVCQNGAFSCIAVWWLLSLKRR